MLRYVAKLLVKTSSLRGPFLVRKLQLKTICSLVKTMACLSFTQHGRVGDINSRHLYRVFSQTDTSSTFDFFIHG